MTSARTTLDEFATSEPDTPTDRLRAIIEDPDAHDFGNDVIHGASPVGMRAVPDVDDATLLRQYLDLCREQLPGDYFSENPMMRQCANTKHQTINTLENHLTAVEFPPETEWPVDPSFVEWVQSLDTPERGDYQFSRQGWERVWDACTPADIEFLLRAMKHAHGPRGSARAGCEDVLTTFQYYHGELGVEALIDVSGRGDGPSAAQVYESLAATLDALDPVIGAMVVSWLHTKVTTNVTESGSGKYSYTSRCINISEGTRLTRARERGTGENTTTHELGHALHDLYGFYVDGGDAVDNRGVARDDWVWNVKMRNPDETRSDQDCFRAVVRQEWEKLRRGELEPLRDYQMKNADEFICVAFECWVVNPERLADVQARMKRLFDAQFGPQNYEQRQARFEPMPSPRTGV